MVWWWDRVHRGFLQFVVLVGRVVYVFPCVERVFPSVVRVCSRVVHMIPCGRLRAPDAPVLSEGFNTPQAMGKCVLVMWEPIAM